MHYRDPKTISKLMKATPSRGFSLIEIMISMTLFSVVALGTFKCLGEGYMISQKRIDTNLANQMIQEEMEYLRSLNFTELSALSAEDTFNQLPEDSRFITRRLVSDRGGRSDQKIVKISINWNDTRGHPHTYSCISFFTQGGI